MGLKAMSSTNSPVRSVLKSGETPSSLAVLAVAIPKTLLAKVMKDAKKPSTAAKIHFFYSGIFWGLRDYLDRRIRLNWVFVLCLLLD